MPGDGSGYAVLFPGQGSQFVGMGADLFAARPDLLGDAADEILGWSLRTLCLEGPEEDLTSTDRAQPALYALGFAAWEVLRERVALPPAAAAGHSLGEYTALAAAEAFSHTDGLRLVSARGRAMAAAAAAEASGMAALIGADAAAAETLAAARRAAGGRLWVANLNAPGQVVVAGGADDIAWAVATGREHGIRRVVPLKVAGAFHSPFMEPAVAEIEAALASVTLRRPAFPVWANATAAPYTEEDAPALLSRQVTAAVRFADSLAGMAAAGVNTFVHVGPGDVTAGLATRSVEGSRVFVVSSVEDAERVAGELAA
jgi:[acyl-carrier-protein] S-malonyltransferase